MTDSKLLGLTKVTDLILALKSTKSKGSLPNIQWPKLMSIMTSNWPL